MTTKRENRAYKKSWPRKNLGELVNFLEDIHPEGISLSVLSGELGIKEQLISNIFRSDDMRLSRAESIARTYGYALRIWYPVRNYPDGYVPMPAKRNFPQAGNLSGLVRYIQDSEYSVPFVAERAHISPKTLNSAFTRGDIKVSMLNQLLDALGICAVWKFTKAKQPDENN